jgi:prolipoprotein diacylglyceryltransferase
MEFTDFILWKAIAIVIGAFLYGLFIGTDSSEGRRDKPPE